MEVNWSALRARLVTMAQGEKVIYLETMIREIGRIQHIKIPQVVGELREMQSEINSKAG